MPEMGSIEKRAIDQAGLSDDELPSAVDPSLAFWKENAKNLLRESIKSIEETAKNVIGVTALLEGLYFHAIAFSGIRGKLNGWTFVVFNAPLVFWLVSLSFALLVFFPRNYASNINSAKESRETFERLVAYKHDMLKGAGICLAVGATALAAALGLYLAG